MCGTRVVASVGRGWQTLWRGVAEWVVWGSGAGRGLPLRPFWCSVAYQLDER